MQHIVDCYSFDIAEPNRTARKLKNHVILTHFNKLSVKRTAQVLGKFVALGMWNITAFGVLSSSATDNAEYCSITNDVFDSLNSSQLKHPTLPLHSAVTEVSVPLHKWSEFNELISLIEFDIRALQEKDNFSSLKGWKINHVFVKTVSMLLNSYHSMINMIIRKCF